MAEAIGSSVERPSALRAQAWQDMADRMQNPVLPGGAVPRAR